MTSSSDSTLISFLANGSENGVDSTHLSRTARLSTPVETAKCSQSREWTNTAGHIEPGVQRRKRCDAPEALEEPALAQRRIGNAGQDLLLGLCLR